MATPEELARQTFGQRASFYTTSAVHSDPEVLKRVVELSGAAAHWRALDVGTGTGHTALALAPHVKSVVAADLTPEMLDEGRKLAAAKKLANVTFQIADAHALPFPDGSFELVTCRRAAHHFSKIDTALAEMKRVLVPGGRLVIDDRSVAEDDFIDRAMNLLDTYHDPSHIREYRPSEWAALLTRHGFAVDAVQPYELHRPLTSLTRDVCAEDVAKIHAFLAGLKPEERAKLKNTDVNGEPYINHWFVMVAATAK